MGLIRIQKKLRQLPISIQECSVAEAPFLVTRQGVEPWTH